MPKPRGKFDRCFLGDTPLIRFPEDAIASPGASIHDQPVGQINRQRILPRRSIPENLM